MDLLKYRKRFWIATNYLALYIRSKISHRIELNGLVRIVGGMRIANYGYIKFGKHCVITSGSSFNPISRNIKACIYTAKGAKLTINDNAQMSSVVLRCGKSITIGKNVKIGANTIISDTDAHSINPELRLNPETDYANCKIKPVEICNNAWIGANVIIWKGVTIGDNSIVAVGSVVTKSIPANEIWGGNPAKFIRSLN